MFQEPNDHLSQQRTRGVSAERTLRISRQLFETLLNCFEQCATSLIHISRTGSPRDKRKMNFHTKQIA